MENYNAKTLNYRQIKNIAETILHQNGVTLPPIPIKEIIERNKLDVLFVNFKELSNKISGFTDFKTSKIYVNASDSLTRQIFTMAHEFGHWILHKSLFEKSPDEYSILLRTYSVSNDPLEKEANCFAANLLVPEFLLSSIKELALPSQLSMMFAVSEETIRHRLKHV